MITASKVIAVLALFFFLATPVGLAVTVNADIPGVTGGATGGTGICNTVFGFYNFALAFGGVLALGAITYGGVKYTMAAGNPSGQSEGKAWVRDALLGLLLLAGAYTILNIINPDITKCGLPPTLDQLPAVPGAAPGAPSQEEVLNQLDVCQKTCTWSTHSCVLVPPGDRYECKVRPGFD
ncbi:MAG: hypothetical protein A2945_02220 [Candidatus Liptonbacteria bacterium RIFCSPLOWO2_01_FULL_52_25]|uniref:Uncharacterized protein n=1 Tax=Candidatus Liptonbacteria bacterium RIFCSPLOWO2_01_FULL_52_25 TaxID=1798650 RepID=A0A1G2CGC8_9BACT|nr:MAG: hypothetical protein A2945_02220 [Candidatus Liptonbacteria bacterium RIFCSPLOWO2_01_FULL_52_25]